MQTAASEVNQGHSISHPHRPPVPADNSPARMMLVMTMSSAWLALLAAISCAAPAAAGWTLLFRQTAGLWQPVDKWASVNTAGEAQGC